EDLPDPDSPVTTINRSRGRSRLMSLRLWVRAPRMRMRSSAIGYSGGRRGWAVNQPTSPLDGGVPPIFQNPAGRQKKGPSPDCVGLAGDCSGRRARTFCAVVDGGNVNADVATRGIVTGSSDTATATPASNRGEEPKERGPANRAPPCHLATCISDAR